MTFHTRRGKEANGITTNRLGTTRSIRVTIDRETFDRIGAQAESRNLPMAAIFREIIAEHQEMRQAIGELVGGQ